MNTARWLALLLLAGTLALPAPIGACPLCKEAIAASTDDEEINNAPAAYNLSIYIMAGVPYVLLGGVGLLVYRGGKRCAQSPSDGDESPR